jgi:hypothetical protein
MTGAHAARRFVSAGVSVTRVVSRKSDPGCAIHPLTCARPSDVEDI